jgi:hypothetical protein
MGRIKQAKKHAPLLCTNCSGEGHVRVNCPTLHRETEKPVAPRVVAAPRAVCDHCAVNRPGKQFGHSTAECWVRASGSAAATPIVYMRCDRCDLRDHVEQDCETERKNFHCRYCHRHGHAVRECWNLQQRRKQESAKADSTKPAATPVAKHEFTIDGEPVAAKPPSFAATPHEFPELGYDASVEWGMQ